MILLLNVRIENVFYTYNTRVPDLKITMYDKQQIIIKAINSWDTFLKHGVKDDKTPLELAESLDNITVKPNTILNLKFGRETENIELSLWSEKLTKLLPSVNSIAVPSENGIYVYRVVGQWKQGTAVYIFKIDVEKT